MRTRIRFDIIRVRGQRRWKDENGKSRQETRVFQQTFNPFNKNVSGNVKTREEILREVNAECRAWMHSPATATPKP